MVVLEDVDFPELIQKLFLVLIHRNYNLRALRFKHGAVQDKKSYIIFVLVYL